MGFFSRNKEAVGPVHGSPAPFETVRRSPRNSRKRAPTDSRFDAGAPLDPAETVKTRARRRLIGAVALALAAIVFVPMLFDRAPAPPADDIALSIPDRDTPFEGRRGVPDPVKSPLKAAGDLPVLASTPSVAEPVEPAAPVVDKSADLDSPKPSIREPSPFKADKPVDARTAEQAIERMTAKAIDKPTDKPTGKQIDKPVDKQNEKPKSTPSSPPAQPGTSDDPRAIAALEGRADGAGAPSASTSATSTSATIPPTASSAKSYAVQVAAYASPEKARGVRDQLVAGGLRSYVESVATAQGLRTRVRLGPFPSREAADRARAKLKTMKLDGAVVPL